MRMIENNNDRTSINSEFWVTNPSGGTIICSISGKNRDGTIVSSSAPVQTSAVSASPVQLVVNSSAYKGTWGTWIGECTLPSGASITNYIILSQ